MRVVALADTHTFTDDEDFAVPEGDVLIHAGDLLRSGDFDEFEVELRWLRSLPHAHKIFVAGNHDHCIYQKRKRAEKMLGLDISYLQDSALTIDGVKIWGSPWQPEFFNLAFNLPRGEKLAEKWALIPDDTDVLVTHGPPFGYGDLAWEQNLGCRELRKALDRVRPRLHVFGHIHEDRGVWGLDETVIANVTTNECDYPAMVFDIDPTTKTVEIVES